MIILYYKSYLFFFQALLTINFNNNTKIENNPSGSKFEQLTDSGSQNEKNYQYTHEFSSENIDTNVADKNIPTRSQSSSIFL